MPTMRRLGRRLGRREGSVILTILADLCTSARGTGFGVTRRFLGVKVFEVRTQLGGRL
jgi:hypothetical protein